MANQLPGVHTGSIERQIKKLLVIWHDSILSCSSNAHATRTVVLSHDTSTCIVGHMKVELGSGLIDYSQKMTMAAMHMADMNV
jgi:hypothetical protein